MRRLVVGLALVVACNHAPTQPIDSPAENPPDRTRHYTIWFGGSRVGTAHESESWTANGVTLRRDEDLRFARGSAVVALRSTIVIAADAALVPERVTWTETGQVPRREETYRDASGWHGHPAIPADAIPAELAMLVVRRDGHFAGPVFLPAREFLSGSGRIVPIAPGRLVARLDYARGERGEATIDVDADGSPARVVDGEGVIEVRATDEEAAAAFPVVDLIAATSIPVYEAPSSRLLLRGDDLALPALPGQASVPAANGATVTLGVALAGELAPGTRGPDRTTDIQAIVTELRTQIAPDLAAGPASAEDASSATAGDCTTYALAYAAHAAQAGIPTRVVTGLRVDGARLVRHRWAVSWTGRAWIAVDAAFGAAPAGGNLIGLAVHDADSAGLFTGDAALTHVYSAVWLR